MIETVTNNIEIYLYIIIRIIVKTRLRGPAMHFTYIKYSIYFKI